MSAEAAIALAYSLFLLGAAAGLDLMARHTHRRSERFRTAGFAYHGHLDVWECPEGQHLPRVDHDRDRRLVRYRGQAGICNSCPSKAGCTDSVEGREIVRSLDAWPRSEAGRFHRAISLALIALAAVVSGVALVRAGSVTDVAALGACLMVALALLLRMAAALRATPAGFPGAGEPVAPFSRPPAG
jgi:hypothetical protein